MNADPHRHALRRRPLFTPLFVAIAVLVVGLVAAGWFAAGLWQPPGTVIVVRHAEKGAAGDNPSLSPEGEARATRLAEMLAAAQVEAIYASQYRRTAETALPLAERLSLPLQVYDASDSGQLVERLLEQHADATVLVVGHSNTVPEIVRRLSGREVGEMGEERYGDVFVVVRPRWGRATVTRFYIN